MNFKRVNNITGWIVCAIACSVYILTMEATGSFWDCGEFISSTFKMQVPHPPGAPLFVMLGRLFIVVFQPRKFILRGIADYGRHGYCTPAGSSFSPGHVTGVLTSDIQYSAVFFLPHPGQ